MLLRSGLNVLNHLRRLTGLIILPSSADPFNTVEGLTLGLRPANERRLYKVTPCLIGWAQAVDSCYLLVNVQGGEVRNRDTGKGQGILDILR